MAKIDDIRRAEAALSEARAAFLRERGWTLTEWGSWYKGDELSVDEGVAVETEISYGRLHDPGCRCIFCRAAPTMGA